MPLCSTELARVVHLNMHLNDSNSTQEQYVITVFLSFKQIANNVSMLVYNLNIYLTLDKNVWFAYITNQMLKRQSATNRVFC